MPFNSKKLKQETELELKNVKSDHWWLLKGLVGIVILIALLHPPHCGDDPEVKKSGQVSTTETETNDEDVVKTSERRPHSYGWGIRRANRRTKALK